MKIKLITLMIFSFSLIFLFFFILMFSTEHRLNNQIKENEIQYNYMYFNSERNFLLRSIQDYSNWDELRNLVHKGGKISSLINETVIEHLDVQELYLSKENESSVYIGDGFYWIRESKNICDSNGKECLDYYLTISSKKINVDSGVLVYKEDGNLGFNYSSDEQYTNTKLFTILFFLFSVLLFRFWKVVVIDKWDALIHNLNCGKGNLSISSCIYEINKISSEITSIFQEKQKVLSALEESSITDNLTGLFNRHYLSNVLKKNNIRSLIIIDIDNFKNINDNQGHDFGDDVLISVARTIDCNTREDIDYCFRWGGEEFLILTSVNNEELVFFLDRLRGLIKEECGVTVSIGACSSDIINSSNFKSHYKKSDLNLYFAKNKGKNMSVFS